MISCDETGKNGMGRNKKIILVAAGAIGRGGYINGDKSAYIKCSCRGIYFAKYCDGGGGE